MPFGVHLYENDLHTSDPSDASSSPTLVAGEEGEAAPQVLSPLSKLQRRCQRISEEIREQWGVGNGNGVEALSSRAHNHDEMRVPGAFPPSPTEKPVMPISVREVVKAKLCEEGEVDDAQSSLALQSAMEEGAHRCARVRWEEQERRREEIERQLSQREQMREVNGQPGEQKQPQQQPLSRSYYYNRRRENKRKTRLAEHIHQQNHLHQFTPRPSASPPLDDGAATIVSSNVKILKWNNQQLLKETLYVDPEPPSCPASPPIPQPPPPPTTSPTPLPKEGSYRPDPFPPSPGARPTGGGWSGNTNWLRPRAPTAVFGLQRDQHGYMLQNLRERNDVKRQQPGVDSLVYGHPEERRHYRWMGSTDENVAKWLLINGYIGGRGGNSNRALGWRGG